MGRVVKLLPGGRFCRRCDRPCYPMSYEFAWSWTHAGRGLCHSCYVALKPDERLDYERTRTRSRDELMTEWELLRVDGYTKRQAADRLGVTLEAFDRAYHRARRDGDPRAVPAIGDEWRSKTS